jgi:choline dehydrogenase-like flavoprotein
LIADADGPGRAAFARPFDVCVIGAGAAGITLALRLAAHGLDVALMEGGGREITAESQEVYEGAIRGQDYLPLDVARLRFLGGSMNHWGGWCRPLDAHDFEPRAWNPMSGWPIGKADLDPYAAETEAILDIPAAAAAPDAPPETAVDGFRRVGFRFSLPPTNFRDKFGPELDGAPRIAVGLNANLVDLRLAPDLARVEAAVFRGWDAGDPGFEVAARAYVLACGGIENPRLLLNFSRQRPAGIGNGHGIVGRYFAEHPHFVLGEAILRQPGPTLGFYAPTEAFMARHEVLNFGLRVERAPEPFVRQPGTVAGDPSCADPFVLRLAEGIGAVAPACAPGGDGRIAFDGLVRIAHEQALDPDSRVALDAATDRFGLRRAALDWRLGALDRRTQEVALIAFATMLAERDVGRVRIRDWVLAELFAWPGVGDDEVGGKHHMGTTRMADDPKRGVVDRDCRVHEAANLWVAGSSVFATGGHANPTYTIVQLALRLGDHLGATLGG